jgi:hypothetical protein
MVSSTLHRSALLLAVVVAGAGALGACGRATESGLERLIESQAGGDVDLDLDGDGGFSIQTEEGGIVVDEDGNFVVTDERGQVVTGRANDDDGFSAETEDGSFRMDMSGDFPDEWPSDVPRPGGIDELSSTVQQSADELVIILTGQAAPSFLDDYASALRSAGYEQTSSFESREASTLVMENRMWTVSINSVIDGAATQIGVTLFPASR